jgi:hypothetical protein
VSTLAEFAAEMEAHPRLERSEPTLEWALRWMEPAVEKLGAWLEFGVGEGSTLRLLAAHRGDARLWGFDSFKGLPEDWIADHPKGRFACSPPVVDGTNLVIGLFEDSLATLRLPLPITLVHLDCDLYSSGRTVLHWLSGQAIAGCVIVLDDLFTPPYNNGLMRALHEWDVPWKWVGRCREHDTGVIRVTDK